MQEKGTNFKLKKIFPFLALASMGLGLSLLCIDPKKVRSFLRKEYRPIFDNLLDHSNEKEEVDLAIENLPEGTESVVAKWMNDSMEGNRRRIAKGHMKPHHVLAEVLKAALELGGNRLK